MSSAFGDSLCLEMSARLFLTTCNWFMFIFVPTCRANRWNMELKPLQEKKRFKKSSKCSRFCTWGEFPFPWVWGWVDLRSQLLWVAFLLLLLLSAYLWPNRLNAAREQKISQKFLRGRICFRMRASVYEGKEVNCNNAFLIFTLLPLSLFLANFLL